MNAKQIIESKLFVFIIQFILLSILIFVFNYEFEIDFDDGISKERMLIIQILANFVLYDFFTGIESKFIIFFCFWTFISFIPAFIYKKPRIVISRNLTALFFPNFFLYIFLSRYSPEYYKINFNGLLLRTFFLTIYIILISIAFSYLLKLAIKGKKEDLDADIEVLEKKITRKCPYCGTIFNSNPLFCYNCSKELPHNENSD
ncbi:MAG: hypothetical protein ACP6IY_00395 [Promethearchaeia archaeon]